MRTILLFGLLLVSLAFKAQAETVTLTAGLYAIVCDSDECKDNNFENIKDIKIDVKENGDTTRWADVLKIDGLNFIGYFYISKVNGFFYIDYKFGLVDPINGLTPSTQGMIRVDQIRNLNQFNTYIETVYKDEKSYLPQFAIGPNRESVESVIREIKSRYKIES